MPEVKWMTLAWFLALFTVSILSGGSGSDHGDSSALPHTSPSIAFSTAVATTTVASVTVTETSTQLFPNPTITSLRRTFGS